VGDGASAPTFWPDSYTVRTYSRRAEGSGGVYRGRGMKAYGYCRVSSVGQAIDGVSLDAQRGKIEAWCNANDVELADVFVDAGLSGGRADNRQGLQDALNAVTKGKGHVLVIYSLSRMARSTKDTILIAERLQKAGANLVSLSEKIDTTSAAGKMVFRMLAVFAEFEKDLASERTKLAAAHKRSKGEGWAHAPYGQAKDDDGRLVPDDGESSVVAEVLALRAEGKSIRGIVDEMNARGIQTRGQGRFHIATVQRILGRASA
jgi:site-specific DNA recombinase